MGKAVAKTGIMTMGGGVAGGGSSSTDRVYDSSENDCSGKGLGHAPVAEPERRSMVAVEQTSHAATRQRFKLAGIWAAVGDGRRGTGLQSAGTP
eukprot:3938562-Rhodomonas_salina.1